MKRVLGSIRRVDEKYHLIEDGDKICIGVSGGKDSLLLMRAMKLYQMFSKTKFDVCAVMLDLGLKYQNVQPIIDYAASIDIPFEVIRTEIGKVVFEYRAERSPCALCAKLRRGALNNAALARGCNKVALGHNREDVLETLLMSMLYEGRMNTFAPVTYLNRTGITVIRPLVYVPEKHCLSVARQLELPVLPANCDVAGSTKREEAKNLIQYLCKIVPDADVKLMHAITNTEKYGLWDRMRTKENDSTFGDR
ncbi:MAG: tRNA 2-thiocytidine biosynthesis protein TtcA [Clostridia bacterium]|nr:tRNA 2-thiocytidine biosynthesis protein TtcA [Clostridia bacterium]